MGSVPVKEERVKEKGRKPVNEEKRKNRYHLRLIEKMNLQGSACTLAFIFC
jgi:hypothetical protein